MNLKQAISRSGGLGKQYDIWADSRDLDSDATVRTAGVTHKLEHDPEKRFICNAAAAYELDKQYHKETKESLWNEKGLAKFVLSRI